MLVIGIFIASHWYLSLFMQTFFLHRYSAHSMFTMNKGWERFFYLLTYGLQGASFLNPRSYAILHRMHHAYSDTEMDPHSPIAQPNFFKMMWRTKIIYDAIGRREYEPGKPFEGGYPEWRWLERFAESWESRLAWGSAYTFFYMFFATEWWHFLFLPIHYLIGPVHGAIVNWFGHKHGYSNFDNHDNSKNTLAFDFLMFGELFQNNHHKFPRKPNFAVRWFEWDPAYALMIVLEKIGIIKIKGKGKRTPEVIQEQEKMDHNTPQPVTA
jgi:stearoyl-CoA desaturase (Delta-9 desaturase)